MACQVDLQNKHPQASEESLKILTAPSILCKTKAFLTESDHDHFKSAEKFYKLKKPYRNGKKWIKPEATDFSKCLDFSKLQNTEKCLQVNQKTFRMTDENMKGFYIIPNMLTIEQQKSIVRKSLNTWCRKPANTNVRRLIELGHADYVNVPDSETVLDKNGERIRWANLGYKYDWTHRRYFEHPPEVPLPDEIKDISLQALEIAGLSQQEDFRQYQPDSCIINYYSPDTQFCGHIDDAELNARKFPIVTISIGLSAVFLHGRGRNCQDRKVPPEAIILNSGDVAIMSGDSRMCLHGVPRVIEGSFNEAEFLVDEGLSQTELEYIKGHRLNVNVRMYQGNVGEDVSNL